jgi:hypothetical protein
MLFLMAFTGKLSVGDSAICGAEHDALAIDESRRHGA